MTSTINSPIRVGDYEIVIRKIRASKRSHGTDADWRDAELYARDLIHKIISNRRFTSRVDQTLMLYMDEYKLYELGRYCPIKMLELLDPEWFEKFKERFRKLYPSKAKTLKPNKASAARRRRLARKAQPADAGFPRLCKGT